MKPITIPAEKAEDRPRRVAAYARISTDLDSQQTSIEAQRQHFEEEIRSHPDWELAGIYCESGVSGTSASKRPELQRLLRDCRAGRIDLVLTKSVSRLSRDVIDCLNIVRELSSCGVAVRFDKENIQTDRWDGEFMLSVFAAFAEEESRSISTNMKWGIRRRFEKGAYLSTKPPYGYGWNPEKTAFAVDEEEAGTVRRIFGMFLNGTGTETIAAVLDDEGVPTWSARRGGNAAKWDATAVRYMLRNPFYIGDTLYQKTYTDERYVQRPNRGECDRFYFEATHPALVDRETFRLVNELLDRRGGGGGRKAKRYCFTGKVRCGNCGAVMHRRQSTTRPKYACPGCGLAIFSGDLENMFATAVNKICFAEQNGASILRDRAPRLRKEILCRGIRPAFSEADAELFSQVVEEAVIRPGPAAEFRFGCGLTADETVPAVVKDKEETNPSEKG